MKTLLITGGTNFVSRYAAEYFVKRGYAVTVLNRGTRPQAEGVSLIKADRYALGGCLRGKSFDAVLDITAYTGEDVAALLDASDEFGTYILVSSSAVYPETGAMPFREEDAVGPNRYWGAYGTNKIEAEQVLRRRVPDAYILRPPYLYGPGNNVYREAFVFDCAMEDRKFYLPGAGKMKLQFFHVKDLCRFMELLLEKKPEQKVYNVGNPAAVSVQEWVELCYGIVGKQPEFVSVSKNIEQRRYFPFYDYEYVLDIGMQYALMPEVTPLTDGLRESLAWYRENHGLVNRKPLIEFIDENL